MKVYTKTGDKGETSLIGGTRVPKFHPRIEAYGTIDELNSFAGLLRDSIKDESIRKDLLSIQEKLFVVESYLALEPDKTKHTYNCKNLPEITEDDIHSLENEMDKMNSSLPELKHFIIPGGDVLVSYCHVCRTICRRAERIMVQLAIETPVDSALLKYVNRLSDYFFVLARYIAQSLGISEIHWKTK
ncbi:MAG: cob(I)yrinic acid a,c-diamide adenosyltransferase [Bacteroidota bacterium]